MTYESIENKHVCSMRKKINQIAKNKRINCIDKLNISNDFEIENSVQYHMKYTQGNV